MKPLPDPSRKLAKGTYERFAQARAAGKILSHAWAEATGKQATPKNDLSLRVGGKRVADREEVKARISFLIEEKKRRKAAAVSEITVPDRIDRAVLIELSREVIAALEAAHKALLESSAPEIRIRQFYQTLSSVLGRHQKMIDAGAVPVEEKSDSDRLIRRFNEMWS